MYIEMKHEYMEGIRTEKKAELFSNSYAKSIFQRIKGVYGSAVTVLKRTVSGPVGKEPRTFATAPQEIDEILRTASKPVYQGNSKAHRTLVDNFSQVPSAHVST